MIPLRLFSSWQFVGANLATVAVYFALGGATFLLVIALQHTLAYSPLQAGAALVPILLVIMVLSPVFSKWTDRVGTRAPIAVGLVVLAGGLLLLTGMHAGGTYAADVLPGVLVAGVGLAMSLAPMVTAVLDAVDDASSGVASGFNSALSRIANLLAVAVLPFLGGASGLGEPGSPEFLVATHRALYVSAAVCTFGGVVAWCTVGRRRHEP